MKLVCILLLWVFIYGGCADEINTVSDFSCDLYTASNGITKYNLSALTSKRDHIGQGKEGDADYIFNFCKPVDAGKKYKNKLCEKSAPVVRVHNITHSNEKGRKVKDSVCVPTGLFPAKVSDHPAGPKSGITILYENNIDLCNGNPRVSEFILTCSSQRYYIAKIEEVSMCRYKFEIETRRACPINEEVVHSTNKDFDFHILVLRWNPTLNDKQFITSGFWPSRGDSYPTFCSAEKFYVPSDFKKILPEMWPSARRGTDVDLWKQEWEKHGSCSGMFVEDYFATAFRFYTNYKVKDTLKASKIIPANKKDYATDEISRVIQTAYRGKPALHCTKHRLDEIALCFQKDKEIRYIIDCPPMHGRYFNSCPKRVIFPKNDFKLWETPELALTPSPPPVPEIPAPAIPPLHPINFNIEITALTQDSVMKLQNGMYSGPRGQKLEKFSIALPGVDIEYMAFIEGVGESTWRKNGEMVGKAGKSIEGFFIRLVGASANEYNVKYFAYLGKVDGYTQIEKNGDFAGTRGQSKACEGLAVWLEASNLKDEL